MSRAALCRLYGIVPSTGYKWAKRFRRRRRWEDVEDRSRRPHHSPNQTSRRLVKLIVAEKRRYPSWGPVPLRKLLKRKWPKLPWPATSTVGAILKREGLVRTRTYRSRVAPRTKPFLSVREPNDVWCIDFKGQFETRDGRLCYPLTVMDAASRYLLACVALGSPSLANVRSVVEELFTTYGLPKAFRSDNGEPFASTSSAAGLTRLSVWWAKLGIRLERIDPGKPQQNGRHERMHLTLKNATCVPPKASIGWQQRAFDRFRALYNDVRPHQALELATPSSLYAPSPRRLPAELAEPRYPFADVYRVANDGTIRWRRRRFFIATSLAGEHIGIHRLDHRYEEVSFAGVLLGVIDSRYPEYGLIRPKTDQRRRFSSKISTMSPV
jgi:putative transposase